MPEQQFDVCIIGAGVAGVACAQGLARAGASVVLLDRLHPMPDCLKAEKIDGESVLSLLRLGFQPAIDAAMTPLHNVSVFFGERSLGTQWLDPPEAGMLYNDAINSLRAHLDPRVDFRPGIKAVAFDRHPDGIDVVTGDGTRIFCRLAVIATGDARHLLESLGATYEPQPPQDVFALAFDMGGTLRPGMPAVDSLTYHHPAPGTPLAYATFFRLGPALRANIFCQGHVSEELQRDLKLRPLDMLARSNRLLAEAARSWQITSPAMIRKVHVARLDPPPLPRIVVLGDVAHTIDPSGGGGLTFSLLEVELLLRFFLPRWLKKDDFTHQAVQSFYSDPRRVEAVRRFFGRGQYIFALNRDATLRGRWRRMRFYLHYMAASRRSRAASTPKVAGPSWRLPAPYLYEH